jgi:hypothetical protein
MQLNLVADAARMTLNVAHNCKTDGMRKRPTRSNQTIIVG